MKKEFLNWLKSLAPTEVSLAELAKKVRRFKRRSVRRGGSIKHRMAEEARKGFIKRS